ncbi:hypothetical protein DPEC_G00297470 [Dallia pectoralis]|uniref:Uncharacterized protein n=1 Tax=Dallia pectoralis TaxID=75939 RepID=A0ACC2FFP5_DALPE|nr:hypothetical protein DPEC_G00297470 [Dallia pectoralis]
MRPMCRSTPYICDPVPCGSQLKQCTREGLGRILGCTVFILARLLVCLIFVARGVPFEKVDDIRCFRRDIWPQALQDMPFPLRMPPEPYRGHVTQLASLMPWLCAPHSIPINITPCDASRDGCSVSLNLGETRREV